MPVTGVASGLPAGWEWDYDGTRWFYTFKANGHVQYHFPSEGDEFPDFVGVTEPAPGLEPEERLESSQQVRRVTGAAPPPAARKKAKENGMTATARPVGIEWDGDVGAGSSGEEEEEGGGGGGGGAVFEPENLMFLGPQAYADVSPLNEEEEEAAKRTVVGVVVGGTEGVSPAETTSAGTPAVKTAEPVTGESEAAPAHVIVAEVVEAEVISPPPAKEAKQEEAAVISEEVAPVREADETERPAQPPAPQEQIPAAEPSASSPSPQRDLPPVVEVLASPALPPQPQHALTASPPPAERDPAPVVEAVAPPAPAPQPPVSPPPAQDPTPRQEPRYELPAPSAPFNPVGVIAEMPTEDTPRSHIELNPIPVEIMDASVLAPIETAPPLGVAELPGQSSAKQQPAQPQRGAPGKPPATMHMKIKRKPTDPSAAIPSPMSPASSSSPAPPVSPPSVASPAPTPPPPPLSAGAALQQYKPYAPVSPLQRADTEPVRARPPVAAQQQGPPSPEANPQLSYAPTVLRPAGRKSTSVSPERRQEGGGGQGQTGQAGGPVQNGMPEGAPPHNVPVPGVPTGQMPPPQGWVPPPGSIPPQGPMPIQAQMPPQGFQPQPGQMPLQGQIPPHGQIPLHGQLPQGPAAPPGQGAQNAGRPPMQHGRPMSMAPPGQYPPVPIPQPYGQYQQHFPQVGQQPGHFWPAPGQQIPGQQIPGQQNPGQHIPGQHIPGQQILNQQIPSQNYTIPPQQQQPASGWMRQSMPPGYPSPQQPPNGRHSMIAHTIPGPIPVGSQHRPVPAPAPSPAPPPNQPPVNQGSQRSSTMDSSMVSPLRSRADSQPSGISLPSPSPLETPQAPPAPQPAVSPLPPEQPKSDSLKVGTGADGSASAADKRKSTGGSYFPPTKDHPVGLVGDIADQFAAEMQALLRSRSQSSGASPATNAAAANPEPKTLVGAPTPSTGHVLGRIEEHGVVPVSAAASAERESSPGSGAAKLAQPSPQTNTTQAQPPATSQQVSPTSTPNPPQGPTPPTGGQPGATPQGAQAAVPAAGQAAPAGPVGSQGPMPPQGFAPQQQWQGKMQQPMQRPPSVPPQIQMQPNKNKENKWTKWFRSSKSEKTADAVQGGIPQQQPPTQGWGQPQQWQPGPPMPGHPIQRPPMQGPMPGHPMPGQPVQGQPMPGQFMQRPPMGSSSMPPQNIPMNGYVQHQMPPGPAQRQIPQMMAQQGALVSHPPQQHLPLQPGQPMQTRPPYGVPMQQMHPGGPPTQMQPPSAPVSPAPSQTMMSLHSYSPSQNSISSSPQTGSLQPQPQGQIASPIQTNLMPAPLSLRPKSGVPAGVSGSGQPS